MLGIELCVAGRCLAVETLVDVFLSAVERDQHEEHALGGHAREQVVYLLVHGLLSFLVGAVRPGVRGRRLCYRV